MASTSLTIFGSLSKEFRCDEDGNGFISLRGLARLCGVRRQSWSQGGSIFSVKIDETVIEQGFVFDEVTVKGIPDTIAALVILHYAQAGKETAQKSLMAFAAYGLRKAIQESLGFKPPARQKLTAEQIIELCCLPCPTTWQRRFPVEYYDHLARLTGLIVEGVERPMLWARLTKELVYDYLPTGIYQEVKRCKAETGSWEKLHQFLSVEGIQVLETHQRRVLEHLQGAANIEQAKTSLRQACTGQYQLVLIGK
jgi:hypothetical protein